MHKDIINIIDKMTVLKDPVAIRADLNATHTIDAWSGKTVHVLACHAPDLLVSLSKIAYIESIHISLFSALLAEEDNQNRSALFLLARASRGLLLPELIKFILLVKDGLDILLLYAPKSLPKLIDTAINSNNIVLLAHMLGNKNKSGHTALQMITTKDNSIYDLTKLIKVICTNDDAILPFAEALMLQNKNGWTGLHALALVMSPFGDFGYFWEFSKLIPKIVSNKNAALLFIKALATKNNDGVSGLLMMIECAPTLLSKLIDALFVINNGISLLYDELQQKNNEGVTALETISKIKPVNINLILTHIITGLQNGKLIEPAECIMMANYILKEKPDFLAHSCNAIGENLLHITMQSSSLFETILQYLDIETCKKMLLMANIEQQTPLHYVLHVKKDKPLSEEVKTKINRLLSVLNYDTKEIEQTYPFLPLQQEALNQIKSAYIESYLLPLLIKEAILTTKEKLLVNANKELIVALIIKNYPNDVTVLKNSFLTDGPLKHILFPAENLGGLFGFFENKPDPIRIKLIEDLNKALLLANKPIPTSDI